MVRLSPAERAEAERKAGVERVSLSAIMRIAISAYQPRSAIRNDGAGEQEAEGGVRVVYDE